MVQHQILKKVNLNHTSCKKDFGAGFYTTTDVRQAIKWAENRKRRCNEDHAYVYSFMLHDEEFKKLEILDLKDSMY